MIFISHSSIDIGLVNALNSFLMSLGIKKEDIFCSSINGQGVANGQRINDVIQSKIKDSEILIFIITQNFVKSAYCTNELGAGWILSEKKNVFIFKSNDVDDKEIKGFVNSEYKYSKFDSNGLSELSDKICEFYNLHIKHSMLNASIKEFLDESNLENAILVENKTKTAKQLQAQQIKNLESQYSLLSLGAKRIIAEIYFSYEGVRYYSLSNGIIGSLEGKLFIHRTTEISTGFHTFTFELQTWVINFINKNTNVKKELEILVKNKNTPVCHEPGHIEW